MSQNSKMFGTLIAVSLALLVAKTAWVVAESKLPKVGINKSESKSIKPLYYRYTLANHIEKEKKIVKNVTKKIVKKAPPKLEEIKKFKLDGVYISNTLKMASITYQGKKEVLSVGDILANYKLKFVQLDSVIFTKDSKEYQVNLYLEGKEKNNKKTASTIAEVVATPKATGKKTKIEKDGDVRVIPKNLFNKYKGNLAEIQKNVGMLPYYEGKKLNGFRVNYVKADSEFSQLGLKRGDIIVAINGEELKDFSVPMRIFNNLDSLSAATITVKRGNETKELEYEVR